MHARREKEREREREREREKKKKEKEKGRGRGRPARAERQDKERQETWHDAARTCLVEARSCEHKAKEARKRTRAGPKRRKGGRRRRRRGGGGKQNPKPDHRKLPNPKTATRLPKSYTEAHANHALRSKQTTSTTNHGVRCAKLSEKTRRSKNRTPKKQASEKENFCRRFRDRKQGFLGPKNLPERTRTPIPEFSAKNSPIQNLSQIEHFKKKKEGGRSPEKSREKNGQHFQKKKPHRTNGLGVSGFFGGF